MLIIHLGDCGWLARRIGLSRSGPASLLRVAGAGGPAAGCGGDVGDLGVVRAVELAAELADGAIALGETGGEAGDHLGVGGFVETGAGAVGFGRQVDAEDAFDLGGGFPAGAAAGFPSLDGADVDFEFAREGGLGEVEVLSGAADAVGETVRGRHEPQSGTTKPETPQVMGMRH